MLLFRFFRQIPHASPVVLVCAALVASLGAPLVSQASQAHGFHPTLPEFTPCTPASDDSDELRDGQGRPLPGASALSADFCSEWNPEFPFNGHRCCSKVMRAKGSRRRRRLPAKVCTSDRFKPNFCEDITDEQRQYADDVSSGKITDVLAVINRDMGRRGDQAYCTVNNGFLAWGRPLVPTSGNHIRIRMPDRCTNYGTDGMVGMIEWASREAVKEYSDPKYAGLRLVVGDITAPRGGCLAGRSGPRGHASHTNGQDADIGFLTPRSGRESPNEFHTDFDAKANWWLIKEIFRNPYACVRVIFLDKRLIRKLGKVARGDDDWNKYWRYIRHIPGHRNHLHVRIGDGPGLPGCFSGANPEDETEELEGGAEGGEGGDDLLDFEVRRNLTPKDIAGPKPASVEAKPVSGKNGNQHSSR